MDELKTAYLQIKLSQAEKALWLKGSKEFNYSSISEFVRKTIADFLENKLKEV